RCRDGSGPGSASTGAALGHPCSDAGQCLAKNIDDEVDLLLFHDEGRRNDGDVAGGLEMQAVVEQLLLEKVAALARSACRMDFDARHQPVATDVGDGGKALQ